MVNERYLIAYTEKNKKIRYSNIELLRVTAVFMIIIHHIVTHCVTVQLTAPVSIGRMNNGFFNQPHFYNRV